MGRPWSRFDVNKWLTFHVSTCSPKESITSESLYRALSSRSYDDFGHYSPRSSRTFEVTGTHLIVLFDVFVTDFENCGKKFPFETDASLDRLQTKQKRIHFFTCFVDRNAVVWNITLNDIHEFDNPNSDDVLIDRAWKKWQLLGRFVEALRNNQLRHTIHVFVDYTLWLPRALRKRTCHWYKNSFYLSQCLSVPLPKICQNLLEIISIIALIQWTD